MTEVKHTMFAARAIGLAEMFKLLAAKPLAGNVAYQAELSAPDGPSTHGGKQAVQHIKLIPNEQSATLIAGSANGTDKTCELRTYAYIQAQHSARAKAGKFGLSKASYDEFFGQLQAFFSSQGFKVSITDVDIGEQPAASAAAGASQSNRTWLIVGAIVALGIAVAAVAALR
jgi:hypothetical protein